MAQSTLGPSPDDLSLINDLYEQIERRPPAIEARKLLVQQLIGLGWTDAAKDVVTELAKLTPRDEEVRLLSTSFHTQPLKVSSTIQPAAKSRVKPPDLPKDLSSSRADLKDGYVALRQKAEALEKQMLLLQQLYEEQGLDDPFAKHLPVLGALTNASRKPISQLSSRPQTRRSARSVAQQIMAERHHALDIAVADLEGTARRELTSASSKDATRDVLSKRVQNIKIALPANLKDEVSLALMHVEHEVVKRTYCVKETMLGDAIEDIPRSSFYLTEDGYPWDLEELVQALTTNGGIMRNPLSKDMFSPADSRAITRHPLGKKLAALQVQQSQLRKGLRLDTITKLEQLASTIKLDMSDDALSSRKATDDLLAYVATLPDEEQTAIDELRVPAKDSHTGQSFDCTIGDAVRDAQANRICFHKAGDLIGQAATYLRQS